MSNDQSNSSANMPSGRFVYPAAPSIWCDPKTDLIIAGVPSELYFFRGDSGTTGLEIPLEPEAMREEVGTVLDSLNEEEWSLVKENGVHGRDLFSAKFKASVEDAQTPHPRRPSSVPSRASNLSLHFRQGGVQSALLSLQPDWMTADPPKRPNVTIMKKSTAGMGSQSKFDYIFVSMPGGVTAVGELPEIMSLDSRLRLIGREEWRSETIRGLVDVEPSIRLAMAQWKEGEMTEAEVREHVGTLVDEYTKARISYGSNYRDFVRMDSEAKPVVENSAWRVQTPGPDGKPSLKVKFTGRQASNFGTSASGPSNPGV